jgi:hypothetical protein
MPKCQNAIPSFKKMCSTPSQGIGQFLLEMFVFQDFTLRIYKSVSVEIGLSIGHKDVQDFCFLLVDIQKRILGVREFSVLHEHANHVI